MVYLGTGRPSGQTGADNYMSGDTQLAAECRNFCYAANQRAGIIVPYYSWCSFQCVYVAMSYGRRCVRAAFATNTADNSADEDVETSSTE